MVKRGAQLGGEASGHLIFLEREMTGDGLLTAVLVADLMRSTGKRLSELAAVMVKLPHVIINVAVADRQAWKDDARVSEAITAITQRLGGRGRLVVRPSGRSRLFA